MDINFNIDIDIDIGRYPDRFDIDINFNMDIYNGNKPRDIEKSYYYVSTFINIQRYLQETVGTNG